MPPNIVSGAEVDISSGELEKIRRLLEENGPDKLSNLEALERIEHMIARRTYLVAESHFKRLGQIDPFNPDFEVTLELTSTSGEKQTPRPALSVITRRLRWAKEDNNRGLDLEYWNADRNSRFFSYSHVVVPMSTVITRTKTGGERHYADFSQMGLIKDLEARNIYIQNLYDTLRAIFEPPSQ